MIVGIDETINITLFLFSPCKKLLNFRKNESAEINENIGIIFLLKNKPSPDLVLWISFKALHQSFQSQSARFNFGTFQYFVWPG